MEEKIFIRSFPPNREALMEVEENLKSYLSENKVAELDGLGVHLTFHEHCMNIIEHGVPKYADEIPEIEAKLELVKAAGRAHAILTIRDETPPFDPTADENNGLGICLIKSISGSITYDREKNRNTCTFVFPTLKLEN